jgi:hypothetical protein
MAGRSTGQMADDISALRKWAEVGQQETSRVFHERAHTGSIG